MRLPDRNDILDYVEDTAGQDKEVQKRILHMLASSQLMREHMAELKRDIYLVSSQVPDYMPDAATGAELMRLSQSWLQLVYERQFSLRNFHRSREFYGMMLALAGVTMLILGLIGFMLLRR
jgi:hypothetical protein